MNVACQSEIQVKRFVEKWVIVVCLYAGRYVTVRDKNPSGQKQQRCVAK